MRNTVNKFSVSSRLFCLAVPALAISALALESASSGTPSSGDHVVKAAIASETNAVAAGQKITDLKSWEYTSTDEVGDRRRRSGMMMPGD